MKLHVQKIETFWFRAKTVDKCKVVPEIN